MRSLMCSDWILRYFSLSNPYFATADAEPVEAFFMVLKSKNTGCKDRCFWNIKDILKQKKVASQGSDP